MKFFFYMFETNSNILFYLRHYHTSLTFHKIRVCTVNNSIPILHDIASGVLHIVLTNIIGLDDAACYRNKHVKGK